MSQKWSIEVTLYEDEDGNLEYDHDADGVQGVGDIYAFDRVNRFYDALKEDEDAMTDEARELMEQAKALNEELIGEIRRAIFEGKAGEEGEE